MWKIKSYLVSDRVLKTQDSLFISSIFVSSIVACLLLPTQTKADNSVFSSNFFNSSDVNLSNEKGDIQITPYGVDGKVSDKNSDLKSYHGIGLRADGENFQVKMEKWPEHYLMGGVGVFELNNGLYLKSGASILKNLEDIKTQTLGGAVGYQKQLSFGYLNLEGGKLFHEATGDFEKVNGDSQFLEGAIGSHFSLLDKDFDVRVASSVQKMEAHTQIGTNFKDTLYNSEFTLYPNANNALSVEYSNQNKIDGAYALHAGLSLSTADWKNFKTSPYLLSSYDNDHATFSYEYRVAIAKQNPALMNSFENAVYIKNSTMQKAITKAVEESKSKETPNETAPNQAPTLENVSVSSDTLHEYGNNNYAISAGSSENVEFSVSAKDPENKGISIEINDQLYTWDTTSLSMTLANGEWKEFRVRAFDWEKYSNKMLIKIKWT